MGGCSSQASFSCFLSLSDALFLILLSTQLGVVVKVLDKQTGDRVLLVLLNSQSQLVTLGQPLSLSPIQFFMEKIGGGSIIYTSSSCTKFRWIDDDDDDNDGSGTQQTFLEGIHQSGQKSNLMACKGLLSTSQRPQAKISSFLIVLIRNLDYGLIFFSHIVQVMLSSQVFI